jgi:hypothetical protein
LATPMTKPRLPCISVPLAAVRGWVKSSMLVPGIVGAVRMRGSPCVARDGNGGKAPVPPWNSCPSWINKRLPEGDSFIGGMALAGNSRPLHGHVPGSVRGAMDGRQRLWGRKPVFRVEACIGWWQTARQANTDEIRRRGR